MDELAEAAKALTDYIEENDVNDKSCDDGDGYTDEWCSDEFQQLIDNVKALI